VFEVSAAVSNPDLELRNKKMLHVTESEQSKRGEGWEALEVCWGYGGGVEGFLQCRGQTKK
jgi:hypothetical protein